MVKGKPISQCGIGGSARARCRIAMWGPIDRERVAAVRASDLELVHRRIVCTPMPGRGQPVAAVSLIVKDAVGMR